MSIATLNDIQPGEILYRACVDTQGEQVWGTRVTIMSDLQSRVARSYFVRAYEYIIGEDRSPLDSLLKTGNSGLSDVFVSDMGIVVPGKENLNAHITYTTEKEALATCARFRAKDFTEAERAKFMSKEEIEKFIDDAFKQAKDEFREFRDDDMD